MKVFVSWSGNDSRKAAELIKRWLPNVIQEVEVWVPTHDIGKGKSGFQICQRPYRKFNLAS